MSAEPYAGEEPTGLWAVVSFAPAEHPDEPWFLVKAPGRYSGPLWWSVGAEDGWGWDQVTSWPGTIQLVREGALKATRPDNAAEAPVCAYCTLPAGHTGDHSPAGDER